MLRGRCNTDMVMSVRCVSHVHGVHKSVNTSSYRDVYAQPEGQPGPGLWGTQVPPVLLQQTQHLLQIGTIQLMQPFVGLTRPQSTAFVAYQVSP